jgi:hypothetical protein
VANAVTKTLGPLGVGDGAGVVDVEGDGFTLVCDIDFDEEATLLDGDALAEGLALVVGGALEN